MGKTCAEYRASARRALTGKYWYAFGMCILVSVIDGLVSGVVRLINELAGGTVGIYGIDAIMESGYSIEGFIILIALTIFVTVPFSIGLLRYFILNSKGRADINELVYPYKNNLLNIITAQIKQFVFIYLWTLLFIIPGIIKSFSYFMVDYIMAENPYITSRRAFEISKQAMNGYKMKAFLLGLSFIGWILLGVITFGIGLIFLVPYIEAAQTELYLDIKASAFERGIIIEGELPR